MEQNWRSGALPNLALAAGLGAFTVWMPPARWSPLVHGAMHALSVVAPAGAAWYATGEFADEESGQLLAPTTRAAIAASAGVIGFGLSVGGNRLDAGLENSLVRRGVSRPRLWMGLGSAALSLVLGEVGRRWDEGDDATVDS